MYPARLITWRGETKRLDEWAEITGIKKVTLIKRIDSGWDLDTAMTAPAGSVRRREVTLNGETHTVGEWARKLGMAYSVIQMRLNSGKSAEDVLSPKRLAFKSRKNYIYMRVSDDEFKLPEIVSDDIEEFCELCGITRNYLYTRMSHQNEGRVRERYVKVKVEDEEDE